MTFALRAGVTFTRTIVVLGALSTLVLVRAGIPFPVLAAVVVVGLVGTLLLDADRVRFAPWALYTIAFVVFVHLRTLADEAGVGVHYAYAADIDDALFGEVPSLWLQQHLYVPGAVGAVDAAAVAVYASYFLVPHVVAFALWRRRLDAFRRYATEIVATCYAGLAVAFLAPTGPPWLAGQVGELPFVARIVKDVVSDDAHRRGYEIVGANPVAAMPSLHMALTVVIVFAMWRLRRAMGVVAAVYAVAMGFALVYLGEHYVVDVVAGALTAGVACALTARLRRERKNPARAGLFSELRG
jgi:membrane-associated phospholipid phosphatase